MTERQNDILTAARWLADRRGGEVIHSYHAVEAVRDTVPGYLGNPRFITEVVKAAQRIRLERAAAAFRNLTIVEGK